MFGRWITMVWLLSELSAPIDMLRSITAAGGTAVLIVGAWLIHKGYYRHDREIKAKDESCSREMLNKQAELDRERSERVRERAQTEAHLERLQGELAETNKQLLSVLETGRRSQAIAQKSLDLAAKTPKAKVDEQ